MLARYVSNGLTYRGVRRFAAMYVLSAVAVLFTAIAISLSSIASGPYRMDITFDVVVPARESGGVESLPRTDFDIKDVDRRIRCSDATSNFSDGSDYIRCQYIADEINYAKSFLRENGIVVGAKLYDISMRPAGGNVAYHASMGLIVFLLVVALTRFLGWTPRLDASAVCALKWRLPVLVAMPGLVTYATGIAMYLILVRMQVDLPSVQPGHGDYTWSMLIAALIVAPVVEELLYRGVIFELLRRGSNAVVATLAGTGLFVMAHYSAEFWDSGAIRIASLIAMSVCLYVLRARYGSIFICIIAHAVFNAFVTFARLLAS